MKSIQLQLIRGTNGEYKLAPTKNSKVRLVTVAPYVLSILTKVKAEQEQNQILFGRTWNKEGFVFTNPDGEHLRMNTVYKNFKANLRGNFKITKFKLSQKQTFTSGKSAINAEKHRKPFDFRCLYSGGAGGI